MNNSTKQNSASAPNKVINVAQAGYYILELLIDEENIPFEVMRHPVIAWAFNTGAYGDFLFPDAITLGGNVEAGDAPLMNAPVLCPDGLVRGGTSQLWKSEDDYLQDRIVWEKHIQACKAEKQAKAS